MSKKLIIFEIICVLIVIGIIGYTYSFFSVTTKNDSVIYGEAASVNLTLTVTKVSPGNNKGLVPQLDDYITSAVIGRKGSCVDDNSNNVCQVYKITLKNNGSSSVFVTGTLALDAKNNPNLKWAEITSTTEPELKSMINKNSYSLLTSNEFYNANEEKNYYIVVWISETGLIQTDNGTFSGVVKFENTDGVPLPAETLEEVTTKQETTSNFLSSNIARQDIESIEFIKKSDLPTGVSSPIDVTYDKTNNANSVQLYSVLNTDTSKYKIYIASESGTIYLKSGYCLFRYLTNMTTLDLTNVDTSNVTNMMLMFSYCKVLTGLNVANFDTSNVTLMISMFLMCEKLTSLEVTNFDTSKVIDMSGMFSGSTTLTSLDLSNFNTSEVTNMRSMFNSCRNLRELNVSSFDTSKVTDMSAMFNNINYMTSLDISNFNTSNVTNMYRMFSWQIYMKSLDLSNFDTSKVIDMSMLFYNSPSLTSLDLSSFNTSNVINMSAMFARCKSLKTLDLSNFNTSKVTDMSYMFDGDGFNGDGPTMALNKIYVSNNFVTTSVASSANMFNDCNNLVGGNGTVFDSNNIDKTYARIDSSSTPGYFTLKV